ncbi:hypothetical protein Poli38472_003682 [Pythium oligandrum]|uniref:Uncharacterized protein n=1 Tax=Pythium oligandrum TaxID=41045 RepID=A0A8K1CLW3_PYTOL|nr:hypothetical protein Poli38472_003682 [Pythium oligandrum]|eukprot:TMW65917.1 hypothetical protein Poli38472_003682 [Pythium oligandrum]
MEIRVKELEAENAELRAQLLALQTKYDELEASTTVKIQALIDENEVLAEANSVLMENEQILKRLSAVAQPAETPLHKIPDDLLLPGEGISTTQLAALDNVHTVGNLLSVATPVTHPEVAATGGVDKQIVVHDWKTQRKLCAVATSAPVLDIAFNPKQEFGGYFAASFMDAKHAVYKLVELDGEWRIEEIAHFQDHTRPGAMRIAWSLSGQFFATGSSDKSVNIYKCSNLASSEVPRCEKLKSFYFNGTVEAITFIPSSSEGGNEHELLAIAVRDDCYVHYVDCVTLEKERINMNQDGIEHVSYTIMDLQVSPSGKYLLAATDKDRHFIFPVKSNIVYRNFYGHKAGSYSQPRVVWHPSEKYIISNTEDTGGLFVWCIASERVVETVDAHEKLVRALACSASTTDSFVLTVSYDKRLKAWRSATTTTTL